MRRVRAYLSHPIRGAKGAAATQEDMEANNRAAITFAARIRAEFPYLDLYVPAEHDEFVLRAYQMGILGEHDILRVDCELVKYCDLLILYMPSGSMSNGMVQEAEAAFEAHIPHVGLTGGNLEPLQAALGGMGNE